MDILFEDNHIIVAYKPVGMLSQEDISKDKDILTELKQYIKVKYNKEGNVYLGLVHRLDRNTSGVMVFARTSKAASRLSDNIKNHVGFEKKYLAVVEGKMKVSEERELNDKLLKNEKENKSYVSKSASALDARLKYKVLDSIKIGEKFYSLLDITLYTGRHHQIRCQLSHIGHPIAGDTKYGAFKSNSGYNLTSYSLSIVHPVKKEEMNFKYFKAYNLFKYFGNDDLLIKYEL